VGDDVSNNNTGVNWWLISIALLCILAALIIAGGA
jgi:hypothetical protein